jgi:hypothetical protein
MFFIVCVWVVEWSPHAVFSGRKERDAAHFAAGANRFHVSSNLTSGSFGSLFLIK